MPNRAVLFDLDDTLHDRNAGVVEFLRRQHASRHLDRHGIPLADWTERFQRLEERGRVWKDAVYRQLTDEFRLPISPEVLLREYEVEFASCVKPMEGLTEMLVTLREGSWRTGIVSNGRSAFQRRTLAALGVESLLDTIVISEECGVRKPEPAIFHIALDALECRPDSSWFVGDDFAADIAGASRVGLRTLWKSEDTEGGAEQKRIARLLEVLDAVGR